MGAGVVTALLDYWDPEGYGMADLMAELDFMHPVGAEGPRKFITVSLGVSGGAGGGEGSDRAENRSVVVIDIKRFSRLLRLFHS